MNNKRNKIIIAVTCLALIGGAGAAAYIKRDAMPMLSQLDAPGISQETRQHILVGDKTGGGHKFGAGKDCKSEFPQGWSDGEIISSIKKVAANDNLKWKQQKNGYFVATDEVNDIKIRVVLDKEKDDIVTGYPVNTNRNACPPRTAAVTKPKPKPANPDTTAEVLAEIEPATGNVANASNRQPRTSNINQRKD